MSDIALYNLLTKVGASPEEAKEAVAEIVSSKDVATKVDLANLETRLLAEMYRMNNRTIMWVVGVGIAIVIALFLK